MQNEKNTWLCECGKYFCERTRYLIGQQMQNLEKKSICIQGQQGAVKLYQSLKVIHISEIYFIVDQIYWFILIGESVLLNPLTR